MSGLLLLLALAVDRWLGEWPARFHPVVGFGAVVSAWLRRAPRTGRVGPFLQGLAIALLLPALAAGLAVAVQVHPLTHLLGGLWLLKGSFAMRMLGSAGLRVAEDLERGDLPSAREGLRSLCSRDPSTLDAGELAAGAVESLAENASDSFVAPLVWYALLGLPGAVAYRAINTLDSMVGYRGEFEWLGKASARLDDLANLLPARLTALLLLLAAPSAAARASGLRTLRRDRGRTASPNAGWPMATMAGLLNRRLTKPGHYALGDGPPPGAEDIRRAERVLGRVARAAALLALLGALLRDGWPALGG